MRRLIGGPGAVRGPALDRRAARVLAAALGLALVALAPAPAAAEPACRVALEFKGYRASTLERALGRWLEPRCEVLADTGPAARRQRALLVSARVTRARDDRLRLRIELRDVASGEVKDVYRTTLARAHLPLEVRGALYDRIVAAHRVEPGAPARASRGASVPARGARRAVAASSEEAPGAATACEASPRPAAVVRVENHTFASAAEPGSAFPRAGGEAALRATVTRPAARPASFLAAGASIVDRSLSFVARADLANPPRELRVRTTGLYATGELYPLSGPVGQRLGAAFVVERDLRMTAIDGEFDAESGASARAEQLRWGVGARYRHPLGDEVTTTSVIVGVGYNELSFTMDRNAALPAAMAGTPDTHYRYVDPSVTVQQPVSERTTIMATARALLFLDAGDILEAEHYGLATVTGADAEVAAERIFGDRFQLRGGARYSLIGYAFQGAGARAADRVGGARDRYLACFLTGGYLW